MRVLDEHGSVDLSTVQSEVMTRGEGPVYQRWEDLLPREGTGGHDDPYVLLSPRQLADLALLARMVWLIDTGRADAEGRMARDAIQIREDFARDGLDADGFLSQRDAVRRNRIRRSRNPSVDGRPVRLLGQMLPLSRGRNQVSEILLTAAVAACSHMPPPPFDQVAYVNAGEPVDVSALSGPTGLWGPWGWVEGTIRYVVSSHIANRPDGPMRVEAAYSIDPARITPASEVDLARHAERATQESEALLFPRLRDLVTRR